MSAGAELSGSNTTGGTHTFDQTVAIDTTLPATCRVTVRKLMGCDVFVQATLHLNERPILPGGDDVVCQNVATGAGLVRPHTCIATDTLDRVSA